MLCWLLFFFFPNKCLITFILGIFFPVILWRTSCNWHFLARSLCLNIDLVFHKFLNSLIKLEQGLTWQAFLICTWKYLLSALLFAECSSLIRGMPDSMNQVEDCWPTDLMGHNHAVPSPEELGAGEWREKRIRNEREKQTGSGEVLSGTR